MRKGRELGRGSLVLEGGEPVESGTLGLSVNECWRCDTHVGAWKGIVGLRPAGSTAYCAVMASVDWEAEGPVAFLQSTARIASPVSTLVDAINH